MRLLPITDKENSSACERPSQDAVQKSPTSRDPLLRQARELGAKAQSQPQNPEDDRIKLAFIPEERMIGYKDIVRNIHSTF